MEGVTDNTDRAARYWAWARLAMAFLLCGLVLCGLFGFGFDAADRHGLLYGLMLWGSVSLLLGLDQLRRSKVAPVRFVCSLLGDYAALGLVLIMGGERMLPVSAVVLWLAVFYSSYYAKVYAGLAWAGALICVFWVWCFSPYWQVHPFLVITLLLIGAGLALGLLWWRHQQHKQGAEIQAKAQLWAQVSHDLRQPLQAIALYNDCLSRSDLRQEQRYWVEKIDHSLVNVTVLFRSVLELYALENEQTAPRQQVVAVRPLLEQVLAQNWHAAEAVGVELRLRCPDAQVLTDPALLMTVVQNLLSNALKYAKAGPVLLAGRRCGQHLDLYCLDRGQGMADEHLTQVFDQFYRAPQSVEQSIEGIGLGLFIVRRISQLLGWQVHIRSVQGRGTGIRVAGLALIRCSEKPVTRGSTLFSPKRLEGLRVCVIEPDAALLALHTQRLEKWGCYVQGHRQWPQQPWACDLVMLNAAFAAQPSAVECWRMVNALRGLMGQDVPVLLWVDRDADYGAQLAGLPGITVLDKTSDQSALRSVLLSIKQAIADPL